MGFQVTRRATIFDAFSLQSQLSPPAITTD
jgi:hypothetical protein